MPNLPLPEGVADQIQALVKEREARDAFLAARVPGKRNNVRERTDADRAKERERSARRRTTANTTCTNTCCSRSGPGNLPET